jgi:imidazolonepropionase-like amidohydrolase
MRSALPVLTMLLGSVVLPGFAQPPGSPTPDLALVGGTIYISPTEAPIPSGVILIQGGKIAAVGTRAQVRIPRNIQTLDCSGRTITAGFWNSHVHFFERKWANAAVLPAPELARQLQDMLTRFGYTSAFDLGSSWENTRRIRDRIESGEATGPRIRSTGDALSPKGPGVPPDVVLNLLGVMKPALFEIANAPEAATAARNLLNAGVDGIKLFASSPPTSPLPDGAIAAAVNEAHKSGKPVFAHPNGGADVLAAIRGGVDVIAHTTPRTGPWDETILAAIKERRPALIPTVTIWKYFARHDRISAQDQTTNTELGQLRAWMAAGGTVLFGNDLGAVDYDPTEEYILMAQSGVNFRQILASMTTTPAERFGDSKQLGRIAAGFQADLVVLKDDPSKHIRALADVQYTLRAGKIIFRAGE